MRVYLCRHAEAAPGDPDELRPLTATGVEQARRLGEILAGRANPPTVVLTSPLLRAQQTAEVIGQATGAAVLVREELAPGATAETFASAVDGTDGPVAVVGHQPDCSEIAHAFLGRDPGFPTGAMTELELTA